jgi:hypothetical protein
MSAPIVPVAPARLSTTTGWPQVSESLAPMMRATMSVPPPGAKPTTTRMVLAGYCWANAVDTHSAANASRYRSFMVLLLVVS